MPENKIELEIPILLPGVEDKKDRCLDRLENAISLQKGIQEAHLLRDAEPIRLCIHYNPDLISIEDIDRISHRAGASISNRYHHTTLDIEGMDCSDCALVIEHSLSRIEGVLSVSVSYVAQSMSVEYDSYLTSQRSIEQHIMRLGYVVQSNRIKSWYRENRQLLFSLATGVMLVIAWIIQKTFALPPLINGVIYLPAMILGGYYPARHAFTALRQRKFDTDVLMILAALGAASLGDFAEGTFLLFLFSLGHALEERALLKTQRAIRSLAEITPRTALVIRDGSEVELPVEQVTLGEIVFIRPGSRLPVDGTIISGRSSVDQSPITGESIPVDKVPGDEVLAGSVNGEGVLQVKTTRLARDSTMSRVVKAVEHAQTSKSQSQNLTERFIQIFVPVVIVTDLLLILVPPLLGVPFNESFLRAMTVLVAASPCALAIGSPVAILSGLAQAARNGVLVKGGVHLENVGKLQSIAFDKTGTITIGKPEVTDVIPLNPEINPNELLAATAAIESYSGHPLALAIQRAAQARNGHLPPAVEVSETAGHGMQGRINSSLYQVGSRKLLEEKITVLPSIYEAQLNELEANGKTIIFVLKDHFLVGAIALGDTIRPGTRTVISRLRNMGLQDIILLSGDNPRTARTIAVQAGISNDPDHASSDSVFAELTPLEKQAAIRSLVGKYRFVGMVGDGINDAPALAAATTGIAIGGAKTDVALETADIALMSADLARLPFIISLGKASLNIVRQNLIIASAVIIGLTVFALAGLSGIGATVLLHEGSTLVVVLNGLRLLSFRDKSYE